MNAGDVFRFVGIADIHAWMIISDPLKDPSRVLMVSFTTWDPHEDQACILESGQHPFIKHRTCVSYPRAKLVTDQTLETLRNANRIELLDPLPKELLQRVRNGAMDSLRLSLELAQILIDQELVE
jgi:hypothetical protein